MLGGARRFCQIQNAVSAMREHVSIQWCMVCARRPCYLEAILWTWQLCSVNSRQENDSFVKASVPRGAQKHHINTVKSDLGRFKRTNERHLPDFFGMVFEWPRGLLQ